MSTACYNLSVVHLFPAFLDPLVDSLVACQRLTSLELRSVTLSLQSFLAVVKGLHNLRALGLESVHFQADLLDEEDKGVSVFEVHLHKLKTIAVFEVFDMSCKSINCLLFQSLTTSDVQLFASSLEHHPRLRELTVDGYDMESSVVKGAVEGMAKRHCVEKLVVNHFLEGVFLVHCHSTVSNAKLFLMMLPSMLHVLLYTPCLSHANLFSENACGLCPM